MLKNTRTSFGLITRLLHWSIFFLLIISIILGVITHNMPDNEDKLTLIAIHMPLGIFILLLVIGQLIWKVFNPTPRFLGKIKQQHQAAKLLHFCLYLLMLAQPITGILMAQSRGYAVNLGLFDLPTFIAENEKYAETMHQLHGLIWLLLVAVVILHVSAALYHHFILKDKTLTRITKG